MESTLYGALLVIIHSFITYHISSLKCSVLHCVAHASSLLSTQPPHPLTLLSYWIDSLCPYRRNILLPPRHNGSLRLHKATMRLLCANSDITFTSVYSTYSSSLRESAQMPRKCT